MSRAVAIITPVRMKSGFGREEAVMACE
jgi:hypothetical protein